MEIGNYIVVITLCLSDVIIRVLFILLTDSYKI